MEEDTVIGTILLVFFLLLLMGIVVGGGSVNKEAEYRNWSNCPTLRSGDCY